MALEAEVSLHRQNETMLLVYLIHTIRVDITGEHHNVVHKLIYNLEVLGNLPNKPLEWKLPDE